MEKIITENSLDKSIGRNKYIDLLRGIGILCVVIQHSIEVVDGDIVSSIIKFFAIYHLPVFFFTAGYFYKKPEELKGITLFRYLAKKIKKMWGPYVSACLVLYVFDIIFGIQKAFTLSDFLGILSFQSNVQLSGALWFVPCLFCSELFFYVIVFVVELIKTKLKRKDSSSKRKFLLTSDFIIAVILGICGMAAVYFGVLKILFIDVSLCMVPVYYLGHVYRKNEEKLNKFINPFIWLPCGVVMFLCNYFTGRNIDLPTRHLYSFVGLYPMIIIGLLFCMSLSKLFIKGKILTKVMSFVGEQSFYIMAYHFLIFYMVDLVAVTILGTGKDSIVFPSTFPALIPLYIVLGCSLPSLCAMLLKKIKIPRKIKQKS